MSKVARTGIAGSVDCIAEINCWDDPKGSDDGQRPRFRSAQIVLIVAVSVNVNVHALALKASREIQFAHEHVTRIVEVAVAIAWIGHATTAAADLSRVIAFACVVAPPRINLVEHGNLGGVRWPPGWRSRSQSG
jgi:hypothetical protein